MENITIDQILNLGTHGVLILIILWQRMEISRLIDDIVKLKDRTDAQLDRLDAIAHNLDNR